MTRTLIVGIAALFMAVPAFADDKDDCDRILATADEKIQAASVNEALRSELRDLADSARAAQAAEDYNACLADIHQAMHKYHQANR